jgi:hypothetical protein
MISEEERLQEEAKEIQENSGFWQQVKNELGPIYTGAHGTMKNFFDQHPKSVLTMMFAMIAISMVIAVIINQQQPTTGIPQMEMQQSPQEINQSFSELQEIQLKQGEIDYWTKVIEQIIAKETISLQDSMLVETAIKELETLNNY